MPLLSTTLFRRLARGLPGHVLVTQSQINFKVSETCKTKLLWTMVTILTIFIEVPGPGSGPGPDPGPGPGPDPGVLFVGHTSV